MLLDSTLPALLLELMSCRSSTALVAPLRSISSRVMTVTGRAVSPSTRLMLEPVTSMRSFDCGCAGGGAFCANAGAAMVPASATATAAARTLEWFSLLRSMDPPGFCFVLAH